MSQHASILAGHHIPPGSVDAEMVDCILPGLHLPALLPAAWTALTKCSSGDDEIVLPKTSSSVFISTNIDVRNAPQTPRLAWACFDVVCARSTCCAAWA